HPIAGDDVALRIEFVDDVARVERALVVERPTHRNVVFAGARGKVDDQTGAGQGRRAALDRDGISVGNRSAERADCYRASNRQALQNAECPHASLPIRFLAWVASAVQRCEGRAQSSSILSAATKASCGIS